MSQVLVVFIGACSWAYEESVDSITDVLPLNEAFLDVSARAEPVAAEAEAAEDEAKKNQEEVQNDADRLAHADHGRRAGGCAAGCSTAYIAGATCRTRLAVGNAIRVGEPVPGRRGERVVEQPTHWADVVALTCGVVADDCQQIV